MMDTPFELPKMTPCVFCELIAGRLDKGLVEETELTLTIVNIRQYEVGQVFVIPRRHAPTILDLTDDELHAIMRAVRRVSVAMVKTYSPDGITLYNNNGVASMQEVPHFHMHVVPRRKSSLWGDGPLHLAALERRSADILDKVQIDIKREREIAEEIRAQL
ncbi:MAG: HIT domain-containing protein [Chloroflexi bacterium]|nr:HIT domain-containing protein [Chloroflexota bacterium]